MHTEISIAMLSAALIGLVHTLAGPDHYLPFVALQKARNWSMRKTLFITSICGIGHTGSTLLIGMAAMTLGFSMQHIKYLDGIRGDWAAWMLFFFGIAYGCWGLYRSWTYPSASQRKHEHGLEQGADHSHHKPRRKPWKELTPWLLFLIFVLGPCEPLLPLLVYPSIMGNWTGLLLIGSAFSMATISTMLIIVVVMVKGLSLSPQWNTGRYVHLIAGTSIALCGAGMLFLGL